MIADKIFRCLYAIDLNGKACECIISNAKEFNLANVKITSKFFPNDFSAIASLNDAMESMSCMVESDESGLVKEYNPEFYPSLNTDQLAFDPIVDSTISPEGMEYLTIKASKNFDSQGDYKNMRMTLRGDDFEINSCILVDPEEYMSEKQKAVAKDNFFKTTVSSWRVH